MPVDYDKLAEQFGGKDAAAGIDYEALASQFGGKDAPEELKPKTIPPSSPVKPSLSEFVLSSLLGRPTEAIQHLPAVLDVLKKGANIAADVGPSTIGAAAGGILGAPLGPPGVIGGGALGAATAGQIADLIKQATGQEQPPTLAQAALRRGTEALAGATQEAVPLAKPTSLGPTVSKEVKRELIQGIRPINRKTDFGATLERSVPEISQAAKGRPIEGIEDLEPIIIDAKKQVWQRYQSMLGPNAKVTIDGNEIADAMESAITKRFEVQNPAAAEKIREIAKTYRKPITLDEAEDFLQDANNDLTTYYKKAKVDQATAARDPEKGYVVKEAQALRQGLYDKLSELTGKDAAEIKRTYGSLESMQEEVARRKIVAQRQAPESLSEQVSKWSAAGNIARGAMTGNLPKAAVGLAKMSAARYLKQRNMTDSLIRSAFARYNAGQESKPAQEVLFRLLPSLRNVIGGPLESPQPVNP